MRTTTPIANTKLQTFIAAEFAKHRYVLRGVWGTSTCKKTYSHTIFEHLFYVYVIHWHKNIFIAGRLVSTQPDLYVINWGCVKDLVEPWLVGKGTTACFKHSTLLAVPQNIIGVDGSSVNSSRISRLTVIVTANKGRYLHGASGSTRTQVGSWNIDFFRCTCIGPHMLSWWPLCNANTIHIDLVNVSLVCGKGFRSTFLVSSYLATNLRVRVCDGVGNRDTHTTGGFLYSTFNSWPTDIFLCSIRTCTQCMFEIIPCRSYLVYSSIAKWDNLHHE